TIQEDKDGALFLRGGDGKIAPLPNLHANRFDVYDRSDIGLSIGDRVLITKNSFDNDKNRMNNGLTLNVKKVSKKGDVVLYSPASKKEYKITKDFGHINHAHVITSYASQGKTVDEVFISQPASTFPATDAKQFYVSASRGRTRANIYTDDKEELL